MELKRFPKGFLL